MLRKTHLKKGGDEKATSRDIIPGHSSKRPSSNTRSESKDQATIIFSHKYFPISRHFFLLLGPGVKKKDSATVKTHFSSARENYCQTIGDGERAVSLNEIWNSFEEFVSVMNQSSPRAKECCIILHVRGDDDDGCKSWCPIKELFKIFSAVKNPCHHLSLLITSSYDGSAHFGLKYLPHDTSLVTIPEELAISEDINLWINSLDGNWKEGASILDLLNDFLINGLRNRHYPEMTIVGTCVCKLDLLLVGRLGKPIEPNVAESLEKKYKPKVKDLVDIARKICKARGEDSFKDSEYGKAVALTFNSYLPWL
ncbi:hypothetical protein BOTNAR_0447g00060 [Botryotinia narcissicola]|uniref:Uncharacterized protein n=1 Tax=Botryotinia narcissicola TaxID=278944 RepID=A0A4Z1HK84_9HELO|nr:hypothetical protein BOTNAR_0447g00060 [Botryotinia narcissicola]